ncbi:MAG: lipocalin family protein [Bacteroidales bacterium]|nr:lipocalin family protein [Bacteroidales bacterium]
MKKVFKVLAMFVMVASMAMLSSCSKEENIVGKWQFQAITMTVENGDPEIQQMFDAEIALMNNFLKDMVWEFKSDNTLESSGLDEDMDMFAGNATYSIEGSTLTIFDAEYPDEPETYEIVTLNGSKLLLRTSFEEEDEDGDIIKGTGTLEFKRI